MLLAVAGLLDSVYLTYLHYAGQTGICPLSNPFVDCGLVLGSPYATIGPLPVALLGVAHYSFLLLWLVMDLVRGGEFFRRLVLLQSTIGAGVSAYLVYLQMAVIGSFCFFCMVSAAVSFLIFVLVWRYYRHPGPKSESVQA